MRPATRGKGNRPAGRLVRHELAASRQQLIQVRWAHRARARRAAEAWRAPLGLAVGGLLLSILFLAGCLALPATASALAQDLRYALARRAVALPDVGPLDLELPQTATILARDGSLLAEINDIHYGQRVSVPLSEIAPELILATIAAEDRRFFSHPGVDPLGLVRALAQNSEAGGVTSGASTLEMQLVRNLFLPDERAEQTISRKIKEVITAYQISERFSKDELISAYLNSIYYGNRAYGAEAAAQRYFGRAARDLTLPQAALLAGIPQSPIALDPLRHFPAAKRRQEYILDQMWQAGFISVEDAAAAKAAPLAFRDAPGSPVRSPHWVNYIRDQVGERYGPAELYTGGLRIQTTLDPALQELAEQVVAANEDVRQQAHANNTALVVLDVATSQVLAMVGSKDFYDPTIAGQVNVALAARQPGSSIKPLVYLAGFERGLSPSTEVLDQRTAFPAPPGQPPYQPANFDNRYYGRVTLRDALGNSLNVPAVKVLKYVGVPALQEEARKLGITTLDHWDPRWLSLTLGGGEVRLLELTGAYATIARLGERLPVEPFLQVETSRGDLLYRPAARPRGEQVVDPRLAYQLVHVLGDVGARRVTFSPSSPIHLTRPHLLKTGTTDDFRDTWTIGCLPQVCVGVWMGNTNNDPMVKTSSSASAGKIWADLVQALIQRHGWPPLPFPEPDGITVRQVPTVGSTRPGMGSYEEVFLPRQSPGSLLEMPWDLPN